MGWSYGATTEQQVDKKSDGVATTGRGGKTEPRRTAKEMEGHFPRDWNNVAQDRSLWSITRRETVIQIGRRRLQYDSK